MIAKIVGNTIWGDNHGFLSLNSPEFAKQYRAGQMCMLAVRPEGQGADPLLKRPFAPYSVDKSTGDISFVYNIVGKGTKILSQQQAGATLSISVPHGKSFKLPGKAKTALVAGGVGLAPIHYLAGELHAKGCEVTIYYGARTSADILPELASAPAPFRWAIYTEDGSLGSKGFATSQLKNDINQYDMCYACGPKPMMKAAQEICVAAGKPIEVSLEEVMGCGIGVCSGCMVQIKDEENKVAMKRCCTEGPVFDGHSVVW